MLFQTPLYPEHINQGAKLVDFAGWSMPLEYTSMLKEAAQVRKTAGLFDVSHMGKIEIKGAQAEKFLQYLCSNNIASLQRGRMQYNLLLNERGGIIDDVMVYNLGSYFLLVVNAACTSKDFGWLRVQGERFEVAIEDKASFYALLALQGKVAAPILEQTLDSSVLTLSYMSCGVFYYSDFGSLLISRSGYSGEDGFEIWVENEFARRLWQRLQEVGRNYHLALCGLGARDILRLEAGYPLYGTDMDEETNPYEAGLGWAVKLEYKDFIGRSSLEKLRCKIRRRRFGFVMKERGFARSGYPILDAAGQELGVVKSGVYSPNLAQFIGSGFLDSEYAVEGKEVFIKIRNKPYLALTKKFPFLKLGVKKEG